METKLHWPLQINTIRRGLPNNTFGMVRDGGRTPHWGWDFYAKPGTPCFAICDGKIWDVHVSGRHAKDGFGLTAVLEFEHKGQKRYAAYCHLSGVVVKIGETVKVGQQIGLTGNGGNAWNMKGLDQHLHFEIRTQGRPGPGGPPLRLDPKEFFGNPPLLQTHMETYNWGNK